MAVVTEEFVFAPWAITVTRSHILPSQCWTAEKCGSGELCDFCLYSSQLQLPHFPEMVFPQNKLIVRRGDFAIEFNALDALKQVVIGQMPIKVACSDDWKMSRLDTGFTEKHVHPFDWTFTTEYSGTMTGKYRVEETDERIDIEKLKIREKILFFKEIVVFEDELHDNGIALCSVKFRIMASGYFLLLRFFLRVDGVLVRVIDTRLYYEVEKDFVLRERSFREAKFRDITHPDLAASNDPASYLHLIPSRYVISEKIIPEV